MLRYLYVSTAGDECVLFWSYGRVRHLLRYSFKTLTVVSAAALRHCNLDKSQELPVLALRHCGIAAVSAQEHAGHGARRLQYQADKQLSVCSSQIKRKS